MKALLNRILLVLLTATAIGGTLFLCLGILVSLNASEPRSSDVIIILGGDDGLRVKKGGELYIAGYAPSILLTGIDKKYYRPEKPNWREKRLMDMGIPKQAINVDTKSETTWEEALNSLVIMKEKGWERAIVVSDPPHMLRLHNTWSRAFRDSSRSFVLEPTSPAWWQPLLWWKNNTSYRFVLSEIQKNIYYAVVYF